MADIFDASGNCRRLVYNPSAGAFLSHVKALPKSKGAHQQKRDPFLCIVCM